MAERFGRVGWRGLGEYAGWSLLMSIGTPALPMPGFVFLFTMFGFFLCCCFNSSAVPASDEIRVQKSAPFPTRQWLYAGHDPLSGVQVSNEPVRRNQIVEDKSASARMWMKEVQDEVWRTRTGNGYKAHMRVSLQYKAKPKSQP